MGRPLAVATIRTSLPRVEDMLRMDAEEARLQRNSGLAARLQECADVISVLLAVHDEKVDRAREVMGLPPSADFASRALRNAIVSYLRGEVSVPIRGALAPARAGAMDSPIRFRAGPPSTLTRSRVLDLAAAGTAGSDTFLPVMNQMTRRHLRELAEAWLQVHAGGPLAVVDGAVARGAGHE